MSREEKGKKRKLETKMERGREREREEGGTNGDFCVETHEFTVDGGRLPFTPALLNLADLLGSIHTRRLIGFNPPAILWRIIIRINSMDVKQPLYLIDFR